MRLRLLRPLLTAAALFVCARPAAAQLPTPNPQQAQQLLQNPELARQLQQRLQGSGLTPDQVRSRLRSSGYSESMLDDYLRGTGSAGRRGGGGARSNLTNEQLIQAMELLGLAEEEELDQFRSRRRLARRDVRRLDEPRRAAAPAPAAHRRARLPARHHGGRLAAPGRPGAPARHDAHVAGRLDRRRLGSGAYERDSLARDRQQRELRARRDSGLAIFGLDLFANGTSLFDANQAGAVDRNYKLGPGDRLLLVLTGDVEQAYPLTVTREGFVLIPQVGQLYVGNLTLAQFDELLYSRLGRVYSGVRRGGGSTRFSVSVVQFRSSQVFVTGDVLNPGSYRVSSAGTALTALYAAGGPSEAGSLRRIEVRRGGRTVGALDVYDYLIRGDASQDVRLESGDVLFVPPRLARVRALGEVLRPATYELKPGETLADLMRAAGGLTALAAPRQIAIDRVVRRGSAPKRVVTARCSPSPRIPRRRPSRSSTATSCACRGSRSACATG
jgi:protein involved in polysaccharide export with SLBB domain